MPLFRTSAPPDLLGQIRSAVNRLGSEADETNRKSGTRLARAVHRAFNSGRVSPLDEMRADAMAADVAHKSLLAQQVQAKLDRDRESDALRRDPAAQLQYAADVAGLDTPTATQAYKALRGVRERPPIEYDDEGNLMPDVTYAMPSGLRPGQREALQRGLAMLQASRLATGPTNAEQLAQVGSHLLKQDLMSQAANAPDVETGNRVVSALHGRLREPFKVGPQGQVLNQETGALNESGDLARANVALAGRKAEAERALAGERGAHAGLYGAQRKKIDRELSGADEGLPAQQLKALTGMKVSDLTPEVRLQWVQNSAAGMTPEQNLAALRQTARRDALINEARLVYESTYPKTVMGQRPAGAPDFLSFADEYIAQKERGTRVPQPGGARETRGRIGGAPAGARQPARPRTQAEYDALPRGAVFIDPDDGQTYRKP
jgi:hypothetical protein